MLVACYRHFGTTHQARHQDRLPDGTHGSAYGTDMLPGNDDGIQQTTYGMQHHKRAETSTRPRRKPEISQIIFCDLVLTNFMCWGVIYIIHVICLLTPRVDVGARNLLPQFLNHNFPPTPRTNITVTTPSNPWIRSNRACQLWHRLSSQLTRMIFTICDRNATECYSRNTAIYWVHCNWCDVHMRFHGQFLKLRNLFLFIYYRIKFYETL
jgi:hypothetical protein